MPTSTEGKQLVHETLLRVVVIGSLFMCTVWC